MNRRKFITTSGAGAAAAAAALTGGGLAPSPVEAQANKKPKASMFASANGQPTKSGMEFLARHGIFHCDCNPPKAIPGVGWDYADAMAQQEFCAKYGVKIESYHIGVDQSIMLGKPERDQHIEQMKQMIEVAGKAGVRALFYNTVLEGNLRTGFTGPDTKRGNLSYNTWDYQEAMKTNANVVPEGGVITVDMTFDRIKYMLDRLLPVAEKFKVQMGNHPADPPTHAGYRGITRWDSPDVFAGYKRFCEMYKTPYHGMNLCVGTTAEGLKNPNMEIHPILRYLGERKQIFNIHFRNIKGGWDHFMEVSVDDGDMDMHEVMRTLRDVGYAYGVQPDHTLRTDGSDPGAGQQYTAFCFGYIKALMQAVNKEA